MPLVKSKYSYFNFFSSLHCKQELKLWLVFRSRIEYSTEEDTAILKFLLEKNLYDKVGGNTTWKIVHRVSSVFFLNVFIN